MYFKGAWDCGDVGCREGGPGGGMVADSFYDHIYKNFFYFNCPHFSFMRWEVIMHLPLFSNSNTENCTSRKTD